VPVRVRVALVATLASTLLFAAGCGTRAFQLRVVTDGAPLTVVQADQLAASTDISALASVSSTDAAAMRTSVLTRLRSQSDFGARAADMLTAGFPAKTSSVPVLVQASKVSGVDAIVVVEAFGSAGGKLAHRRLWIFDRATGALIRASSFR
jgi:hypothetical protein